LHGVTAVFEDLGVYRVLSEMEHSPAVAGFICHWLGPLVDYDRRKGGDLVRTLSAYLEHGGSQAGAAEAISVHRSTLRYRLDRIRSILGLDLSKADTRFNLQLATRAWTTLAALK
jgi:DNA-binding PucR family transcriptional regulator